MKGIKKFTVVLTIVLYALIAVGLPTFAEDEIAETTENFENVVKETVVENIDGDVDVEIGKDTGNAEFGDGYLSDDGEGRVESIDTDIDLDVVNEDLQGEDGVDFVIVAEEENEGDTKDGDNLIIDAAIGDMEFGKVVPNDVIVSIAPESGKEVVGLEAVIKEIINHDLNGEEAIDTVVAEDKELKVTQLIADPDNHNDNLVDGQCVGSWKIETDSISYVLFKTKDNFGFIVWKLEAYDQVAGDYEEIELTVTTQDIQINPEILNDENMLDLTYDEYQINVDYLDDFRVVVFNGDEKIDEYVEGYEEAYMDRFGGKEGLAIENIRGVVKNEDGIIQDGIVVEYDAKTGDVVVLTKDGMLAEGKYTVYLDGYYTESRYNGVENTKFEFGRGALPNEYPFKEENVHGDGEYKDVPVLVEHDDHYVDHRGHWVGERKVTALNTHSAWARFAEIDIIVTRTEIIDGGLMTDSFVVIKDKKSSKETARIEHKSDDYDDYQLLDVDMEQIRFNRESSPEHYIPTELSVVVKAGKDGFKSKDFTVLVSDGNRTRTRTLEVSDVIDNGDGTFTVKFFATDFSDGCTYSIAWNYEKLPTKKAAAGYAFVATGIN